jgi:hypothetical protein
MHKYTRPQMRPRQRRVFTYVGSVVLAALLLVPLALRAHHHGHGSLASPACAACALSQHAPLVHPASIGLDAPAILVFSAPLGGARPAVTSGGTPTHGRAPPRNASRAA